MNKKIGLTGVVLLVVMTTEIYSQNQLILSLKESIDFAQTHSPSALEIKSARKADQWDYKAFRSGLYPEFNITGNAPGLLQSINPITKEDGTLAFREQKRASVSTALEIAQPITLTGGSVSLSTGLERFFIFSDDTKSWDFVWQSTPIVLGLNQPLFQYNPYRWSLRLEPLRNQLSERQFNENMENLAIEVTQTYFDVYIAKMNMDNALFNVGVNDTIFKLSENRYNVGKIAENELLQTELALLNAQTNYQNAQLNHERSLEALKIKLGIASEVNLEILPPDQRPSFMVDIDQAAQLARENSSFLTNTQIQELVAKQQYEQIAKNTGFQANLTASYGLNKTAEEISDLYSDLANRSTFTVGFEIPIFNWGGNKAKVKAAKERMTETQSRLETTRKDYALGVEYRVRQFALEQTQLQIAIKSDDVAQRRFDLARKRYEIGKLSITDLLIAQSEKDNARISFIQSLRRYWIAWYELRKTTLFDFEKNQPISYTN